MRYSKNLKIDGNKVYSYNTHVATIKGNILLVHGNWNVSTSKHINYVANMYGLTKKKSNKRKPKKREEITTPFKSASLVALMGDIFGNTDKEKNDWKKRMLGTVPGLSFPDDFDILSEKERKRRLDGAIEIGIGRENEKI